MGSRPGSTRSRSTSSSASSIIGPIQEERVSEETGELVAPTESTPLLNTTKSSSSSSHGQSHYDQSASKGKSLRKGDYRIQSKSFGVTSSILILLGVFTVAITISVILKQLLGEFSDSPSPGGDTDPRGRRHPAVLAKGHKAGVAAENVICSQIGVDILKEKGSAVDAAIAGTLCTGVLNMFSSGIGGGGFMIIRDPTPCYKSGKKEKSPDCIQHITIDFRETGPSAANKTMYVGRIEAAQFGGLSVGVPGELRGLQEAHKRFGRLPWSRLVQPSVELAKESKVSKELARRLDYFGKFMLDDEVWREVFVNPDTGSLLKEGDTIRRPTYAKTLETLSTTKGIEDFYSGEIAKNLVETVQSKGGILTLQDMKNYKVQVKPALEGRWTKNRKVWTTQAPTSGPILLSILNILSGFSDFADAGPTGLNMHRFIEALKFGFGQRTELADPDFMTHQDNRRIEEIPTMQEADRIRPNITDDRTHSLEYYNPKFDILSDHGTMHLSVLDEDGMAIALTSTVNLIFGSRVMDPKTGIILNDEMDDTSTPGIPNAFGLAPSPFNYPNAGKRPLSSTCPTIIEDEDSNFLMVLGGSGGSRIFSSVLQTMFNFLDWEFDLSTSIEKPRLHHQLLPTELSAETTYDEKTLNALRGRGHEVSFLDIDLGIAEVQAVAQLGHGKRKQVHAASDSRKGGIAVAY